MGHKEERYRPTDGLRNEMLLKAAKYQMATEGHQQGDPTKGTGNKGHCTGVNRKKNEPIRPHMQNG